MSPAYTGPWPPVRPNSLPDKEPKHRGAFPQDRERGVPPLRTNREGPLACQAHNIKGSEPQRVGCLKCDESWPSWDHFKCAHVDQKRSFGDMLDVPPEVIEELDRVFGEREEQQNPQAALKLKRPHEPPFGADMVLLPKHYSQYEIEPIRFIVENKLDYFQQCFVRYGLRAEHKHSDKGLEDHMKIVRLAIMKAKWLRGDPDWWKAYRNTKLHQLIQEEATSYAT